MCIPVQKYKFQYKNKSFGTKKYLKKKKLEKIGRYFIYDYYYVPKYMLIIVYLNKTYIFHYYKLSRLYSAKHHLTPLYTTPYTPIQHHMSMYNTMHLYTSRCTSIHPCQHPCIIPCTSIHHHITLFITIHLYTLPHTHV